MLVIADHSNRLRMALDSTYAVPPGKIVLSEVFIRFRMPFILDTEIENVDIDLHGEST